MSREKQLTCAVKNVLELDRFYTGFFTLLFRAQMGFSSASNYCIVFLILMKLLDFLPLFLPCRSFSFHYLLGVF